MRGCIWLEGKYLHTGIGLCNALCMQARIEGIDEMMRALGAFAKRAESGLKGVEGCSGGAIYGVQHSTYSRKLLNTKLACVWKCGNKRAFPGVRAHENNLRNSTTWYTMSERHVCFLRGYGISNS